MPDISMCATSDCPIRKDCYRSEASGTQPNKWWQSWSAFTWRSSDDQVKAYCDHFEPVWGEAAHRQALADAKADEGRNG